MLELTKALKIKCEKLNLRYVPGSGLPISKFYIIGEAPGKEENDALQCFIGPAGGLLNSCCRNADVDRNRCFVGNISPVRPPDNKLARLSEVGVTMEECVAALKEQIKYFKPNVVLALGAFPLSALTGNYGIRDWRGHVLDFEGTKIVGSFHPAFMLHMGDKSAKKERENAGGIKYTYGTAKMALILDLMRAKEEAEYSEKRLSRFNLEWGLSQEEELQRLEEFKNSEELAFDVETTGDWTSMISFADSQRSVSFLLDKGEKKAEIKESISGILANHSKLIAHNGMFDMEMLAGNEMPVGRMYADTMIAHHLIYPEFPHGLDFLASIYEKLERPPHAPGWNDDNRIGYSNALHSALTLSIWKKLKQELKEIEKEIKENA